MNGVVIVSPFGDGGSMSSSSSSSSPPPVVTAVVRFDVSAGAVIDRVHPESASVPASVLDCLPAYALPDGVHRENLVGRLRNRPYRRVIPSDDTIAPGFRLLLDTAEARSRGCR